MYGAVYNHLPAASAQDARMSRLIHSALLLPLLAGSLADELGATDRGSPQQLDARIEDTPLFTIGDDPSEPLHDVIGAVLTDNVLIIAEESTHSLRFYDRSTGRFLHAVGQQGEGPGDYGNLDLLQAVGDRLYTWDSWLTRVTIRNRAGEVERTVRIRPWGDYNTAEVEGIFPDGSMLVSAWAFGWADRAMIRRDEHGLARYDPDGNLVAGLGTYLGYEYYDSPDSKRIYPYRRETFVVVVGDRFHIVDNKDPVIPAFDAAGKPVQELPPDVPTEPTKLTRAGRDSLPGLDGIDRDDMPRFYPFYGRTRAVGDALWAPHYGGLVPGGGSAWSVYSQEGDLVGRVTASERLGVLAVDGDTVAVLCVDELGVQTVQLRRMVEG